MRPSGGGAIIHEVLRAHVRDAAYSDRAGSSWDSAQRVTPAHVLIARLRVFHFTSLRLYSRHVPVTDPSETSIVRGLSSEHYGQGGGVLARSMEILSRTDVLVLLGTSSPTFRSSTSTIHQAAVHPSNEPLCSMWNRGLGHSPGSHACLSGVGPGPKIAILV